MRGQLSIFDQDLVQFGQNQTRSFPCNLASVCEDQSLKSRLSNARNRDQSASRVPRRVDQTPGLHSFHLKFSISIHFKGRIRPKFHPFAQTLRGPGSRRCYWTRLLASVPCPALAGAGAQCATLCLLTTFYDCLLLLTNCSNCPLNNTRVTKQVSF